MKIKFSKDFIGPLILILVYLISILNLWNPNALGGLLPSFTMHLVFATLFTCSFIVILNNGVMKKDLVLAFTVFMILLLPSVFLSEYIDIAFIKFLSFMFGLFSLIFLSNRIIKYSNTPSGLLYIWFRNINRFLLVLSAVIYIFGLGYTVNPTGFAGVLNHPQAFGVFLILIILIELYGIQSKSSNKHWSYFFIIIAFFYSILTESRLSVITIVFLILLFILLFIRLKKSYLIVGLILLFVGLVNAESILSKSQFILTKSGRATSSGLEALDDSRGFLVRASITNFTENPLTGIGFQTSNGKHGSYPMTVVREPIFNLPLQATVEKGVFWSAILEETGILGFLGFTIFVIAFYKKIKDKRFSLLLGFCLILMGMGESFFFSFGGVGAIVWCVYFMIYIDSNDKHIIGPSNVRY